MTKYRKLFSIFLSTVLTLFQISTFVVRAEEIVITGNGGGSSNEVTLQASNNTSVEQSNSGDINNNVDTEANTGENEASDNVGDASIETGDVNSSVEITNSLNSSQVSNECCPTEGTTVEIKGNGNGSTNNVDLSVNNAIRVDINQQADIDNHVSGSANSGDNRANDNNGNVSIETGNINVFSKLKNGPVNVYQVNVGTQDPGLFATISENGSGSNNLISALFNDLASINANNNAQIKNHLVWDMNTGRNDANGNNGNVTIKTGNIFADLYIENGPINSGSVDVSCCKESNPPPPPPGENPPPPPGGNPPPGSSNPPTSISAILGISSPGPAVLGLSATGGLFDNPVIFWMGLLMLTFGLAILGRSLPPSESSRNET